MKRNILHLLFLLVIVPSLFSCERIGSDDRWLPIPESEIPENASTILVEDYTGQHCVNCPSAARLLQEQKKLYGDKFILVSMHAPRTGMTTPSLAAAEADVFATRFGHERSVPGIMINREIMRDGKYYSQTTSLWASEIRSRIMKPSECTLDLLQVEVDSEHENISFVASASFANEMASSRNYRMDFWIVEDVIAPQSLPSGTKTDYFHHNVFRGSLSDGFEVDLTSQNSYEISASLPKTIDVLDNSKIVAMVCDVESGRILVSKIHPLGIGIEPDSDPDPDVGPDNPGGESGTLYFNINSSVVYSGSEVTVKNSVLLDQQEHMYAMDSPLSYIYPGKDFGLGKYDFTVSKMDHSSNPESGLMMVCVDGKCMPASNPEMYKGSVNITTDKPETSQAFSVHTFIKGKTALKSDVFRYRISFLKDGKEIAYLILRMEFSPSNDSDN